MVNRRSPDKSLPFSFLLDPTRAQAGPHRAEPSLPAFRIDELQQTPCRRRFFRGVDDDERYRVMWGEGIEHAPDQKLRPSKIR